MKCRRFVLATQLLAILGGIATIYGACSSGSGGSPGRQLHGLSQRRAADGQ